jgi:hypothetical protein
MGCCHYVVLFKMRCMFIVLFEYGEHYQQIRMKIRINADARMKKLYMDSMQKYAEPH